MFLLTLSCHRSAIRALSLIIGVESKFYLCKLFSAASGWRRCSAKLQGKTDFLYFLTSITSFLLFLLTLRWNGIQIQERKRCKVSQPLCIWVQMRSRPLQRPLPKLMRYRSWGSMPRQLRRFNKYSCHMRRVGISSWRLILPRRFVLFLVLT